MYGEVAALHVRWANCEGFTDPETGVRAKEKQGGEPWGAVRQDAPDLFEVRGFLTMPGVGSAGAEVSVNGSSWVTPA